MPDRTYSVAALPERLLQTIRRLDLIPAGSQAVLAVSGGADSLALLYALATLRQPLRLTLVVATLDHMLRGPAGAADAAFVCEQATTLGLLSIREQRDVAGYAARHGLSTEEAAREVRYAFLADVAQATRSPLVATAHTADDQAETVLMHFLRGSGLSGLKGMLPRAPLPLTARTRDEGSGGRDRQPEAPRADLQVPTLVRPLLYTPRSEIEAYLAALGLEPRQDATNIDQSYFRNRLRHELLPLLERYQPNIRQVLARSAEALASEWAFIEAETGAAWKRLAQTDESSVRFERVPFLALPDALQRHLLRRAVAQLRPLLRDVSWEQLTQALSVARRGPTGAAATLPGELSLFVRYDTLVLAGQLPLPPWPLLSPGAPPLPVLVPGETSLPDGWRLVAELAPSPFEEEGQEGVGPAPS
ncbi:MAG: tRNA lysidine(34) synthetase TilS [Ardenticatenaceae bacterium]|nr:tRNA lysidine(34) synthetase TilS [Ardenticatenaceae bacterium]